MLDLPYIFDVLLEETQGKGQFSFERGDRPGETVIIFKTPGFSCDHLGWVVNSQDAQACYPDDTDTVLALLVRELHGFNLLTASEVLAGAPVSYKGMKESGALDKCSECGQFINWGPADFSDLVIEALDISVEFEVEMEEQAASRAANPECGHCQAKVFRELLAERSSTRDDE